MILRGGCQCGGVRFEIEGKLMGVGHCHCGACRKAQGAAMADRPCNNVSCIIQICGNGTVRRG